MEKPYIKPITKKIAEDYLIFKSKESVNKSGDSTRFLSYRNELIPAYFTAEGFCTMINDLRRKIWEYQDKEKKSDEKSTVFQDAFYEIVLSKSQNMKDEIGIIRSLIGVLLHVFKDSAYKEYIEQSEAEMVTNLRTNEKEEEFVVLLESLKNSYFFDQEIGNEMNSSENERYFEQAWGVFGKKEIQDMPEEEKRKLYEYLYEKYAK